MKESKKRDPLKGVIAFTILFAILAAGAFYGETRIKAMKDEQLTAMQSEVEARNQQAQSQYQAALSEFEQQTTSGANLAWPQQSMTGWDVVDLTSYPLENVTTTTLSRQEAMYEGMLLVNEWHSRPDDFLEDNLVSVSKATERKVSVKDNTVRLFPQAVEALQSAIEDAGKEGLENYVAWEGYRSWDEQNTMFQAKMAKYSSLSEAEQIEKAKKEVNYPGTSEFNTGLTVDLRIYKQGDATINNTSFFESEQGIWMYQNSWKYGLVFRFPLADYPLKGTQDKSYKTGVSVKIRGFRYVGLGNAAAMHAMDLCLEEYIDYLSEHPHIAVFENGILKYEIVREYVGDVDPITIHVTQKPGVRSRSTSLDNMGYAVTVFSY
ncbi:MAG: M15 family metallopeptidase [Clostridia bacterium]|nr:M15 family metallopeptidase [Clostridia bacterium]